MADDIAALGFSVNSKPLADATGELKKLSSAAGEAEKAAKGLSDTSDKAGARLTTVSTAAKKVSSDTKKASTETSMLAEQLKSLGSASSIGGGIGSVVDDLIGGLASTINPANLATVAISALTTAAIAYFSSLRQAVPTAEQALKDHAKLIQDIEDRWPGATQGLHRYVQESTEAMESAARGQAKILQDAADSAKAIFTNQVSLSSLVTGGSSGFFVGTEFKPFEDALNRLQAEIAEGKPNFQAFHSTIQAIVATDPAGLTALGDKTNELVKAFEAADGTARAARASISLIGGAAASQVEQVNQLATAMRTLAGIGLPDMDDRQKAQEQYEIAVTPGQHKPRPG